MLDALNTEPDATPEKTVFNVTKGINAFVAGNQQFDDITMLALTYNGPREENKDWSFVIGREIGPEEL